MRKPGPKLSKGGPAIQAIASLGLRPINNLAARGIHGSTRSGLIPSAGIDCRQWSREKIEQFFRQRYSWLGSDSISHMALIAMQDGRIEAAPGISQLLNPQRPMTKREFRKSNNLTNAAARKAYADYLKRFFANAEAKSEGKQQFSSVI
jgi:hypothetical protein